MKQQKSQKQGFHPVRLALRYPKTVLLLACLATVLSLNFALKLTLRSNFADLLPDNHPTIEQAKVLNEEVGGATFIVLTVETKDSDAGKKFIDDFSGRVMGMEGVQYVDYRSPEGFFQKHGLLYLSLEDLDEVHQKAKRKIEQAKLKATGFYIEFEDEDERGFDLASFQEKYGPYFNPHSYYQNTLGTFFVSLIKPEWRTTDVARTEVFLGHLEKLLASLNPQSYHPSLSVRLTGPYVKQMAQQKILRFDVVVVSLIALLGSIAYLTFHFRRKRAVFLIAVPLIMSVTWTLALAYLFYGSLNLFSSVACAIIIGLAADYGIHLYSEYLRHREDKKSPEESFLLSIHHLKRPFFIAATTTAAAFFSLTISHFKAFSEFGMIAGPGILLCAVAFTFLMPPLALLLERVRHEKIKHRPVRRFRKFVDSPFASWLLGRRAALLIGLILLLPLAAVVKGRLTFDYNVDHIMGQQPTKALDRRVDAVFSNTVNPEVALVENAEDAARLADVIRRVRKINKNQPQGTTLKNVVALPDFVPDHQQEKIQKVAKLRSLFDDDIIKALSEEDQDSYKKFEAMLHPVRLGSDAIPEQILTKFTDRTGQVGRILFIFPNFKMNESDSLMRYVEEIRSAKCTECQGAYYVSGESSVFYEIIKMLFSEGKYVMVVALMAVFLLLFVHFRSVRETCLVFAPLLLSQIALLGWMALLEIPFNIINMAAFPIIFGVVTDYVVHFYERYRHENSSASRAFSHAFSPILGSTLTTLIGFGSLLFADMGGLRSLGGLAFLGILLGSVTTLFWFPAVLAVVGQPVNERKEVLEGQRA